MTLLELRVLVSRREWSHHRFPLLAQIASILCLTLTWGGIIAAVVGLVGSIGVLLVGSIVFGEPAVESLVSPLGDLPGLFLVSALLSFVLGQLFGMAFMEFDLRVRLK